MGQVIGLSTSSPEELSAVLQGLRAQKIGDKKYVSLALSGDEILVTPFQSNANSVHELKKELSATAVDLHNLPLSELVYDFQIFSQVNESYSGILVSIPKEDLEKYLTVCRQNRFELLSATAYILSSINAFLIYHNMVEVKRFAIIDFSRASSINFAVIDNNHFELLRKVPYESPEEGKQEVIRSLRSACARSSVKDFDKIYFSGDIRNKGELFDFIRRLFNTHVEAKNVQDVEQSLEQPNHFFTINLAKNFTLTLKSRLLVHAASYLILAAFLAGTVTMGIRIAKQDYLLQKMGQYDQRSLVRN